MTSSLRTLRRTEIMLIFWMLLFKGGFKKHLPISHFVPSINLLSHHDLHPREAPCVVNLGLNQSSIKTSFIPAWN